MNPDALAWNIEMPMTIIRWDFFQSVQTTKNNSRQDQMSVSVKIVSNLFYFSMCHRIPCRSYQHINGKAIILLPTFPQSKTTNVNRYVTGWRILSASVQSDDEGYAIFMYPLSHPTFERHEILCYSWWWWFLRNVYL